MAGAAGTVHVYSAGEGAGAGEGNVSALFNHTLTLADDVITRATALDGGNITLEDYLAAGLGSRRRPLGEAVVLSIVYTVIFLTGLAGNVSTCIVITRNNYMHTATNYYLFSLAISDVLTLITGLPPELYSIWEAYPWAFGQPYCLIKIFLQETTSSASVLTITAFTFERYFAICHPIRAQTMSSLRRVIRIIILIWGVAAVTAIPYPIHSGTFYYMTHPATGLPLADSLACSILPQWKVIMKYMFQFSTFILFVAPMTIITITYIQIGLTLRRSGVARRTSSSINSSPSGPSHARKAVLKMLVAVVVAFFICWAPFHAQRLMTAYVQDDQWTTTLMEIQTVLFYISGVLYFVGSTVNPILYNLMSRKYRQAFKDTMCRCWMTDQQRRHILDARAHIYSNTYSTAVQTRHLAPDKDKAAAQGLSRSPAIRRAFKNKPSTDLNCSKHQDKVQKWGSWREKLLSKPRKTTKTGNGFAKKVKDKKPKPSAPNGNACTGSDFSRSDSTSPRLAHVDHIREELEMRDVCKTAVPEHDIIYSKDRINDQGTPL